MNPSPTEPNRPTIRTGSALRRKLLGNRVAERLEAPGEGFVGELVELGIFVGNLGGRQTGNESFLNVHAETLRFVPVAVPVHDLAFLVMFRFLQGFGGLAFLRHGRPELEMEMEMEQTACAELASLCLSGVVSRDLT